MRSHRIIVGLLSACMVFVAAPLFAQDTTRRVVVEEVPSLKDIRRVAAARTHSGYPVPRYVSLKVDPVNGRQGPSVKHRVLWQYQQRGTPFVIVAEMDIWRKIRDQNGDESWVRTQALSGERHVIAVGDVNLRTKPRDTARINAIIADGGLMRLLGCNEVGWCRVKTKSGHKGWIEQSRLWGAQPL